MYDNSLHWYKIQKVSSKCKMQDAYTFIASNILQTNINVVLKSSAMKFDTNMFYLIHNLLLKWAELIRLI